MSLWTETAGQGQPLYLLHGWGMNAAVWEPLREDLVSRYQVTVVDLPGHGYSDMAEPSPDLQQWARQLLEVAPDNAVWMGWSLGALLALQAALDQPERISGLFLLAGTPCFAQREDWSCAMPQPTLAQFARNLRADPEATLMRFLSLQIQGTDGARQILKVLRQGFGQRPTVSVEVLEAGLQLLQRSDLRPSLEALEMPVNWLLGEKDTLIPACVGEALGHWFADTQIRTLQGAGHVPFLSHWSACRIELERFFQEQRL